MIDPTQALSGLLNAVENGDLDFVLKELSNAIARRRRQLKNVVRQSMKEAFKDSGIKSGDLIFLPFPVNDDKIKFPKKIELYYVPAPPIKWNGFSFVFLDFYGDTVVVGYPTSLDKGTASVIRKGMTNKGVLPNNRCTGKAWIPLWYFKGFEKFAALEDL